MSRWYDKKCEYKATICTIGEMAKSVDSDSYDTDNVKEQLMVIRHLCKLASGQITEADEIFKIEQAAQQ